MLRWLRPLTARPVAAAGPGPCESFLMRFGGGHENAMCLKSLCVFCVTFRVLPSQSPFWLLTFVSRSHVVGVSPTAV